MPDTQTQNAFGGQVADQTTPATTPTADQALGAPQKSYTYQEGERIKTFTGSDEIFNAYANSQQFIGTLKNEKTAAETELEELKLKYNELNSKQISAQEVLNELHKVEGQQQATPPVVDQDDLTTIVREQLSAVQQEQAVVANVTNANSALTSAYGDRAAEHVARVAGENGMTVQEAQALAGKNPLLFNNIFLSNKQSAAQQGFSTPSSSMSAQQAASSQFAKSEPALMWQQKEGERVKNLRQQREEMRKQMQL